MAAQPPQQQYLSKLTSPDLAVQAIPDGSTLCIALGMGMPSGLAKAFAERVLAGDLLAVMFLAFAKAYPRVPPQPAPAN
jgi:acyl-CoA hydrolase